MSLRPHGFTGISAVRKCYSVSLTPSYKGSTGRFLIVSCPLIKLLGVVTTWTESGLTCPLSLLPCHALQVAFIPILYLPFLFHFLDTV